MARPVDADSAKTYESIVDAALQLLGEDPSPDKISLRSVAQRAGVSLGTIQYYFPSKTELLEACLDGYYDRLNALVAQLLPLTSDPTMAGRKLVERVTAELFHWACKERGLLVLRMATNSKRGELHPSRQQEFMGLLVRQAAEALQPHIQIEPLEARLSIQSIVAMVVRMALLTDEEVRHLTDLSGDAARDAVERHVIAAASRLMQPVD